MRLGWKFPAISTAMLVIDSFLSIVRTPVLQILYHHRVMQPSQEWSLDHVAKRQNRCFLKEFVGGFLSCAFFARGDVELSNEKAVSPRFAVEHALRRYPNGGRTCIAFAKLVRAICPGEGHSPSSRTGT